MGEKRNKNHVLAARQETNGTFGKGYSKLIWLISQCELKLENKFELVFEVEDSSFQRNPIVPDVQGSLPVFQGLFGNSWQGTGMEIGELFSCGQDTSKDMAMLGSGSRCYLKVKISSWHPFDTFLSWVDPYEQCHLSISATSTQDLQTSRSLQSRPSSNH